MEQLHSSNMCDEGMIRVNQGIFVKFFIDED